EGRDYIVQEYLDGRPLNEIIAERKLPLSELAELAIPLAEALDYAHGHGVIHRDLKPANVIVTTLGHAKLLYFGLAKVLQDDSPQQQEDNATTTLTLAGAVFGTPSAMSPEQALGKAVDARSDVFAFGALLYEMAAGKPAFLGTTVQETLDKVLHHQPESLGKLRRDLPADFVAIVEKCLRKDADERYQSMSEVVADLRYFKRATDSGIVPPAQGKSASGPGVRVLIPLGLIIVLLLVWQLTMGGSAEESVPRLGNARQLTSAMGLEGAPFFAKEGGLIAYHARRSMDVDFDLWIQQEGGGAPVNRSEDVEGDAIFPSISPDGRNLAFWLIDDLETITPLIEPRGLYITPVIGGSARRVVADMWNYGPPQWSADGKEIAFLEGDVGVSLRGRSIKVVNLNGEVLREHTLPSEWTEWRGELSWSPNGRFFAFVDTVDPHTSDTNRLWILRAADGASFPLSDGRNRVVSPDWSRDSQHLYYLSNRGGSRDLWRQVLDEDGEPEGEPVAITAGIDMARASLSGDGTQIAYSRGGRMVNLWRAPLRKGNPVGWSDTRQVTFDDARIEYADISPDGKQLVLSSNRSGNPDLWRVPSEGGEMQILTDDPTPDWFPRWSPDGKSILFYAYRSGNRDLWLMPSEGGAARQLTSDPGTDWFGEWSPDGSRIHFASNRGGVMMPYVSALEPFAPKVVPVAKELQGGLLQGQQPWIDADTRILIASGELLVLAEDGSIVRRYSGIESEDNTVVILREQGTILVYTQGNVHGLNLETGETWQVTDLGERPGKFGAVLAGHGEQFWFSWAEERGDLWVMDVVGGG
ncbi:MAG: serine/threonine-protein kinase, partial [Planctomycetota bacterium]